MKNEEIKMNFLSFDVNNIIFGTEVLWTILIPNI